MYNITSHLYLHCDTFIFDPWRRYHTSILIDKSRNISWRGKIYELSRWIMDSSLDAQNVSPRKWFVPLKTQDSRNIN